MRVSAAVDYAVRAAVVLATAPEGTLVKGDVIADGQGMSFRYCEQLCAALRKAGLVVSQRGTEGGYRLARPADQIVVADIVRAVDGPLGEVRGLAPEDVDYPAPADHVRDVWVATRSALRSVLEHVTLADVAAGALPAAIQAMLAEPEAWERRPGPGSARGAAAAPGPTSS